MDVNFYNGTAGASIDTNFDARRYEACTFTCTGLGAGETVAIQHSVAGTWVTTAHLDPAGATNTAILFTGSGGTPASVNAVTLDGLLYRFTSTTPAGVVKLVATPRPRNL